MSAATRLRLPSRLPRVAALRPLGTAERWQGCRSGAAERVEKKKLWADAKSFVVSAGATGIEPAGDITLLTPGTKLRTARENRRPAINVNEVADQQRHSVEARLLFVEFLSSS